MRIVEIKDMLNKTIDIVEDDAPEWDNATTYNTGDQVMVSSAHRLYTSLIDSNTGIDPTTDDGTNWRDDGATNAWRVFDEYATTQSEQADSITISYDSLMTDAVGLFNIDAQEIDITIINNADSSIVYSDTISLRTDVSASWSDYFFSEFLYRHDIVEYVAAFYPDINVQVVVKNPGNIAKVGSVASGRRRYVGKTLYPASAGAIDFSRLSTDRIGTKIESGRYAKRNSYMVRIEESKFDDIYKQLSELKNTPTIFLGDDTDSKESLVVYGFIKDFSIDSQNWNSVTSNILVEGIR